MKCSQIFQLNLNSENKMIKIVYLIAYMRKNVPLLYQKNLHVKSVYTLNLKTNILKLYNKMIEFTHQCVLYD